MKAQKKQTGEKTCKKESSPATKEIAGKELENISGGFNPIKKIEHRVEEFEEFVDGKK